MVSALGVRRLQDLSCCILAGGRGTRLGVRKHRLARCGVSLIQRQIELLKRISDDVFVVVKAGMRVEAKGAGMVVERFRKFASIFGLLTALKYARHDRVLLVACDMPQISTDVARRLFRLSEGCDIVVPESRGELHMTFAVYDKSITCLVESRLRRGLYSMKGLVPLARSKIIHFSEDSCSSSFANVNRPSDLKKYRLTIIRT